MPKRNIVPAVFDIRPKKEIGPITVDLKIRKEEELFYEDDELVRAIAPQGSLVEQLLGTTPRASQKEIIAREIEDAFGEGMLVADLVRAGGTVHEPQRQDRMARPRVIQAPKVSAPLPEPQPQPTASVPDDLPFATLAGNVDPGELEQFWKGEKPVVVATRASFEPAYHNPTPADHIPAPVSHFKPVPPKKQRRGRFFTKKVLVIAGLGFVSLTGFAAASFHSGQLVAKQSVLENGNEAIANLEEAKGSLEKFEFSEAADHFAAANADFEKASGTLSNFGASFLSLFGDVPGLSKVRSANNLIEAGKEISGAGEHLSQAFGNLYKTNVFAMINPAGGNGQALSRPLNTFKDALNDADAGINKAQRLLAGVAVEDIPEDKRLAFATFKDKIPDFQMYIGQAIDYSNFLLKMVGEKDAKTYLVLLQNTSERRPTGGFPGTYAIIAFDRGVLKKVFVDDIYNPDGQAKENVIPPVPLQHITPTLGMRDANWFADFPTSARKIEEYYANDGGAVLDGVFAITPDVITKILRVMGPIDMPEYGVTLTADNFVAEVQDNVEVKGDRTQPKKIVMDFQPLFFEELAHQDHEHWLQIAKILMDSMRQKEILAYFNDKNLEQEVRANGFGGEVLDPKGDYASVVFSNVKGSKSDAVTKNSFNFSSDLGDAQIGHTMVITRAHQGGNSKYPFYNKDNPSYVKVYVPKGSVFEAITGQDNPNYKPLVSHEDLGFKSDPDLVAIEQTMRHPLEGVDVFEEADKTVFGFWMITKPQKTSTVRLTYHTPADLLGLDAKTYTLLWQKQLGSQGDQLHVNVKIPDGHAILNHSPDVQVLGTTAVYDEKLSVDREVGIIFN